MPSIVHSRQRLILAACIVALAVLAVPFAGFAQSAPINIAVVNLDFLVANSSKGKELQARLERFQQEISAEAARKGDVARELRKQISDGINSMSEAKLADLRKQYEDAGIAIKRYQDDKQREGQKMQAEGMREIEKQLEPVFKAIRDEGGYDLILNSVPGVVVMVGERVEITQKVLERLNATAGS